MSFIKDLLKPRKKEELELIDDPYYYYKRVAYLAFLMSVLVLLPSMVYELLHTGRLVFLYYGDYNVQQVPFYEHCVRMVHEGKLGWDWNTDLGSNFIGSYSYYLIGSPFFWLMCLFPSSWAPYLMGPVYVLKYVAAAVIAYAYFKRFVKDKEYAVIGGLLYAFCGFQIYNTFFNQFHEVVALFPLLLLGMEELVQNDRKGLFAFAVMLNCMCNYFMFAGQVVFCLMYFFVRCLKRSFRIDIKKLIQLGFEAVLGVCLGAVVFLPASLAVMSNYRLDASFGTTKNLWLYGSFSSTTNRVLYERYGHIIQSLFFPPDIPSRINFFYSPNSIYGTRWASNAAWIPAFGFAGVFAWLKTRKRSAIGWFVIALTVFALVPVFNSMFFLFNSNYYARWMYMLVLIGVLCTVTALEERKSDFSFGIKLNSAVIIAVTIFCGLLWEKDSEKSYTVYSLGREPFSARLWVSVAIALGCMIALHFIIKRLRGTKLFTKALLVFVCATIVIYGNVHIFCGKAHSTDTKRIVEEAAEGELNLPYEGFSRLNFYRTPDGGIKDKEGKNRKHTNVFDNLGISWETPSVECFHSVVPASINDFYKNITNSSRAVGSRYNYKFYGLNGFLSVKYSALRKGFDPMNTSTGLPTGTSNSSHPTDNIYGLSFTFLNQQNNYNIYENNNFLDMGFYYDTFITESDLKTLESSKRHILLCKYLIVPDDMADYYSGFMKQAVSSKKEITSANQEKMISVPTSNSAEAEAVYLKALEERRNCVCDSFEYDSYSFNATISMDKANVVLFTVPYEDGWTAQVNGKDVDVLKVAFGFMGVECSGAQDGRYSICFTYKTPGLKWGGIITVISVLIFALYLFIMNKNKQKPNYKFFKQDYFESECSEDKLPSNHEEDYKPILSDEGEPHEAAPKKSSAKVKAAMLLALLSVPICGIVMGSASIFTAIRAVPEVFGDNPKCLGKAMTVIAITVSAVMIAVYCYVLCDTRDLKAIISLFIK